MTTVDPAGPSVPWLGCPPPRGLHPRSHRARPQHRVRARLQRPRPRRAAHRRRAARSARAGCSGATACTAWPATTSRRPAASGSAPWSTCAPRARSSAAVASRSRSTRSTGTTSRSSSACGPRTTWSPPPARSTSSATATSTCSTAAAASIARIVELVADGTPLLFHCAAGKDRTGVVAAVLLGLAGVPHEEIAADYHATAGAMAAFVDWLTVDLPRGARLDDEPAAGVPRGPARGDGHVPRRGRRAPRLDGGLRHRASASTPARSTRLRAALVE